MFVPVISNFYWTFGHLLLYELLHLFFSQNLKITNDIYINKFNKPHVLISACKKSLPIPRTLNACSVYMIHMIYMIYMIQSYLIIILNTIVIRKVLVRTIIIIICLIVFISICKNKKLIIHQLYSH